MVGMAEDKKSILRRSLEQEEMLLQKDARRKITTSDFESLAVIGRGAFGEVRLVRHAPKRRHSQQEPEPVKILALKSMKKEMTKLVTVSLQCGKKQAHSERPMR